MLKKEYSQHEIYKKSIHLIKDFVSDILNGEIDHLASYCFEDLKKYINTKYEKYVIPDDLSRGKQKNTKWTFDSDDTAIARACYCVLWGYLFDIGTNEDNFIGSRTEDQDITAPYRGDTMNSFNSVLGKMSSDHIPSRIQMYGLDCNLDIMAQVRAFHRTYHMLGNMILLPNRGKGGSSDGLNNKRADYKFGLRDYFDYFLMNWYVFQNPEHEHFDEIVICRGITVRQLMEMNSEYERLKLKDIKRIFILEDYFEGDIPKSILDTSIDRFKTTRCITDCIHTNDYTKQEYTMLAISYMKTCTEIIHARSMKMVETIKKEINEFFIRI